MDTDWFKKHIKKQGITADRIAARMGRDRSNVSKILAGKQRMTLDWARAFAQALDVPLDQVLEHAGEMAAEEARTLRPGFSEGDATPFTGKPATGTGRDLADALGAGRAGRDIWEVQTNALLYRGFRRGDMILVDANAAERARAGDIVLAQAYDLSAGTALTLLREYRPPVLIAFGPDGDDRVHVVDGVNVVIRGVVRASWRALDH